MHIDQRIFILLFFISNILSAQEITFSEHIAPIIYKNCTPCHQKGQVAPMPFTNYEEVSAFGSMIKYVTGIRYMPPWKPVNDNHHYKGERQLTDAEINLISEWVENGLPEGKANFNYQKQTKEHEAQIENPDAIISMSEAFEQYGVYYDQFRVFILPTNFKTDKIISAIEFVPGNASIVRSCFISVDNSHSKEILKEDNWDPQYGYFSFGELGLVPDQSRWYNWTPLKNATFYPKDQGKYLPKNSRLLLHIHYGPTGIPQKDSSYIKLKFRTSTPAKLVQNIPLIHPYILTNPPLEIPANEKIRYHAKFKLPFDVELSSITPHAHFLGKKMEIFAVEPKEKKSQILLKIEDWDFKWKQQFEFTEPVLLRAGTVIHSLVEYDNTIENLLNPSDPPRAMKKGKRMFEELFLVYFEFLNPWDSDLKILPDKSLIDSENVLFRISLQSTQILDAKIRSFTGEVVKNVFSKRKFDPAEHHFQVSLKGLPKGNYYLELSTEDKGVISRSMFVWVEDDFLN